MKVDRKLDSEVVRALTFCAKGVWFVFGTAGGVRFQCHLQGSLGVTQH